MSKIIMEADRPTGILHQVQTEDGKYYWVSTVRKSEMSGNETMVFKCREDGYTYKDSFRHPALEKRFTDLLEAAAYHYSILKRLESVI